MVRPWCCRSGERGLAAGPTEGTGRGPRRNSQDQTPGNRTVVIIGHPTDGTFRLVAMDEALALTGWRDPGVASGHRVGPDGDGGSAFIASS